MYIKIQQIKRTYRESNNSRINNMRVRQAYLLLYDLKVEDSMLTLSKGRGHNCGVG